MYWKTYMKFLLLISVFVLPSALVTTPCGAQGDPADPGEVARMISGHTKAEGIVTDVRSGLYTVKTSTGTYYTLAESVAARYGQDKPKIGDEMILFINEGNNIMDARKKGATAEDLKYMSGKLVSINYGKSHMTISTSEGERQFKLRPENRMFREFSVGTPVTLAVNELGEIIDLHADSTSDVPRSGLGDPDRGSALEDFRHLGPPEKTP